MTDIAATAPPVPWEDSDEFYGDTLTFNERVDIVKSAVSLPEIVEMAGFDIDAGGKIRPPWNETERTPSTHVYEDHFYDFSSGKHGDMFDFMAELDRRSNDEGEIRSIGKMLEDVRKRAIRAGHEPGDVEAVVVRKLEELTDVLPEIHCGMVAGVDVSKFGVRRAHDGTVFIPHAQLDREEGPGVYGIKLRTPSGKKSSVPGSQFTHRLYSPTAWTHLAQSYSCVITEGESDAWAMWHAVNHLRIDVFALPSGASAWKDHWLKDLEPYGRVLLCFDNDRAGKQALDKVTRKVGFDRAKTMSPPALYNDAREALQAGWIPSL